VLRIEVAKGDDGNTDSASARAGQTTYTAVEPAEFYNIILPGYLTTGGDGFDMLRLPTFGGVAEGAEGAVKVVRDGGWRAQDLVAQALRTAAASSPGTVGPVLDGRIEVRESLEPVIEAQVLSQGTRSFLLFVASLSFVLTLASMWGVVHFRQERNIMASSWVFLELIGIGLLFLQASSIFHTLPASPRGCLAMNFFYHLGILLVFGSLFLKTYRLDRIFNHWNRYNKSDVTTKNLGQFRFDFLLVVLGSVKPCFLVVYLLLGFCPFV
jgi:hypothetical protein